MKLFGYISTLPQEARFSENKTSFAFIFIKYQHYLCRIAELVEDKV
ncbi:hypothetical protein [Photobacterium profundum]|uniref:Uncharacterized protein n=1 Tax=Photobacterium profundum 3TCK TaxID=314280 RepID=Q1Z7X6_9GAMM|nr:hypothetical protein [Photobacterium profundum]EAS44737.1 hypothetical protein P3TCK_27227 [Photobacterium profundum 3TCK]